MRINRTRISVVKGSVIDCNVDCIVNAANNGMRGGGGIDGAIHEASGRKMVDELAENAPQGARTAQPVLTHGYNLKQPWVIHVAGPIYQAYPEQESRRLLREAYDNSLLLAHEHKFTSVAFCSLSTGVYGFPLEPAASIALRSAMNFADNHPVTALSMVIFAMYREAEYLTFSNTLMSIEEAAIGLQDTGPQGRGTRREAA